MNAPAITDPTDRATLVEIARRRRRARQEDVETRGADTLVYGNPKGAHTKLTLRLPDVHHFEVAITLSLSVDPLRVHLFDPQSERRIGN